MAKEFARAFYNSPAWKHTRKAYAASVGGLCERCLRSGVYTPGVIVHHIRHLTPENITDPKIALNPDNLISLCRKCHYERHNTESKKRYTIDEATGKVTPK